MTSKPIQPASHNWSPQLIEYIEQMVSAPFQNLTIQKLAGDASDRTYWRIKQARESRILLQRDPYPQEGETLPYINIQRHLLSHGVHVPRIQAFSPPLGVLLLEDFGDTFLEKMTQKMTPKQYAKHYFLALDELFKIQFRASRKTTDCVAFTRAFDKEKLVWELTFTQTYLIQKYLGVTLSDADQRLLSAFYDSLSEKLANQPYYFAHRDYHSRNLMWHNEKIGVLDFQDARLGTCHYDLASLLKDSYVALPDTLIEELINYYIYEKERHEKIKIDKPAFAETFDWMCIQRNLKAMGTFAYLHLEKGKSNYLKYIKPTWFSADQNLSKFHSFKAAHRLLQKIFEELT